MCVKSNSTVAEWAEMLYPNHSQESADRAKCDRCWRDTREAPCEIQVLDGHF